MRALSYTIKGSCTKGAIHGGCAIGSIVTVKGALTAILQRALAAVLQAHWQLSYRRTGSCTTGALAAVLHGHCQLSYRRTGNCTYRGTGSCTTGALVALIQGHWQLYYRGTGSEEAFSELSTVGWDSVTSLVWLKNETENLVCSFLGLQK